MNEPKQSGRRHQFVERFAKPVYMWLAAFGVNLIALRHAFPGLMAALRELAALRRQNRISGKPFRIRFTMPCLSDRYEPGGHTSGHYFYQDLLVARRIFERNPVRHVDVGSRVDGFVSHVASFREIEVFDIRPLAVSISSIVFRQMDLMNTPENFKNCCDSLSCLHAIEHFGLGRYGDPVDLFGHIKGVKSLGDILKPGGLLYLSVPIGPERIDFNANRVFAIKTILDLARERFELESFSYVDDSGELHEHAALDEQAIETNLGCQYGCGIFELRKMQSLQALA
jgi:SAM-dependent methyltransferase